MVCSMQEPRDTCQALRARVAGCAVVVRPLVGLDVLFFLFRENRRKMERDGERWREMGRARGGRVRGHEHQPAHAQRHTE